MRFPEGFLWGASTSAYQIEGGNEGSAFWGWEAARGWERSGKAAESWRLWREDIECLKRLNLNAYRFSVEWSRVEPAPDEFREDVLRQYERQAVALRLAGIRPIVCLHHFSEPAWLFKAVPRGWLDVQAPIRFIRFAGRVAEALAGEVRDWLTFNEPMVWLVLGYWAGHFPPGIRSLLSFDKVFARGLLLKHVLDGHSGAAREIRAARRDARVGIAQHIADVEPATAAGADSEAMLRWDTFMHRRLLDMAVEARTLDFVGVNYYTRIYVRRSRLPFIPLGCMPGYAEAEAALGPALFRLLGGRRGDRPRTGMGWEVVPEGLARVLRRVWNSYKLPVMVTENGIDDRDGSAREGFIRGHLRSVLDALASGVDVTGYLHWSLMDNYEWGSYAPRFGLFRVDRQAGFKRNPAAGADLLAGIARTNSLE